MLRIEGMWGPRSRGDGEAAALDRLVPTDSVNRASLNSNIMPGVSDCLAVMLVGWEGEREDRDRKKKKERKR